MGILSKELPEHIDTPEEWKGTDDDTPLMRWRLKVKYWFSFGVDKKLPQGLDLGIVFLPGLYLIPFTIWFTGWSWWYLFPVAICPMMKRWREYPTTIVLLHGDGPIRLESTDSKIIVPMHAISKFKLFPRFETSAASVMVPFYFSRIQRWCRWHFAIQWPFLVQFHWYWKRSDVPSPENDTKDMDGKVFSAYRGWHRDGDRLYWGDGAGAGNFK